MDQSPGEMSLRDYARVVRRRGWIVLAALFATVVGSLVMSLLQERIYAADAEILVSPRSSGSLFDQDGQGNAQSLERAIQTEIRVIEGQQVRIRVQELLGLDDVPPKVSARSVSSTDVVVLTVRSADAEAAQQLADAYAEAYSSIRLDQAVNNLGAAQAEIEEKLTDIGASLSELDAQIAEAPADERDEVTASLATQRQTLISQQAAFNSRLDEIEVDASLATGGASVIRPAELPTSPVEPQPLQSAVLAGVVGLLLGLGAAFLVDYLDDSVRTHDDVERLTEHPVLAVVPIEAPRDHRPIALSDPQGFAVETYRGLRTTVQFLGLDQRLRVIQVTSGAPGEGKTTTATNLAVVLAQAGDRVVLVDGDLRKPRIHEVFALPPTRGLTEALLGEPIEMVIDERDGLSIIVAGTIPHTPSEMLSSPRLAALLEQLAERFDYVIVDSAPVLPVADAVALSRVVDGVLLVVQVNRTSKPDLRETLLRLDRVGATVTGVVLNRAKGSDSAYGYGYHYADATSAPTATTPPSATTPPPSTTSKNPDTSGV